MSKNNNINSQFFYFKKKLISEEFIISDYMGWNSLKIVKFETIRDKIFDNKTIDVNYPELKNKQKIFIVTKGYLEFEIDGKKNIFTEFDAIDFVEVNKKFEISVKKDTVFFIISAINSNNQIGNNIYFNFKNDIEKKDLWGGQCISRPYEGVGLTVVLFDLKNGFEFEDKGHANEQITWLIEGEMKFYANGESKILTSKNDGIDIGPHHIHGGVSAGAIGFDAFFPKRQEAKYRV